MTGWLGTYNFLIVSMTLGAMLALSLYLSLMSGQLSLASPAFYAIGGYIAALVSTRVFAGLHPYPVPLLLGEMILAALVCGLVGWGLGVPGYLFCDCHNCLLRGVAGADPKFGDDWGAIGIFGIPQPFGTPLGYLWLTVPLWIGVAIAIGRLEQTRAGNAMQALRADELVAQTLGIDTTRYKVLGFVLGAILAGVTGVLAAHLLNTWNPRQGTFDTGVLALTAVLVGGNRTFVGAIAGGMLFTALPELLRGLADQPSLPTAVPHFSAMGGSCAMDC